MKSSCFGQVSLQAFVRQQDLGDQFLELGILGLQEFQTFGFIHLESALPPTPLSVCGKAAHTQIQPSNNLGLTLN
jgi:hypothetical protein